MIKKTITVGIPAHNEGANIAHLLADILRQKTGSAVLKEIIVASDGSTDDTSALAKVFNDTRIKIYTYQERKGKAFRQNQIIKKASGDILVLLDADIALTDVFFIKKLIQPLLRTNADMTSGGIRELPPRTFFEGILDFSMQIKHILFSTFKNGNNVYMCHGPARAFKRKLFEKISFTVDMGEDMYSYFSCINNGSVFKYVDEAIAYYRLPSTFVDHKKQSVRYLKAKEIIRKEFGDEMFFSEIDIPLYVYLMALVKSFSLILRHPFRFTYYIIVLFLVKILSKFQSSYVDMWNVSSSKVLRA